MNKKGWYQFFCPVVRGSWPGGSGRRTPLLQLLNEALMEFVIVPRFLMLMVIMLIGGCSATPSSSSLSPDHPASPDAPESPYSPSPTALAEDRTTPTQSPEYQHKMQHQEAEAIYACPMHADIVQNAPGKCPKCGMSLVKRQSSSGLSTNGGGQHE
ncbi:MAG TPA: hypothetical protein DET40_24570 [Lentisphaeria bacterium]|nr:MAG: hypothetical protein A2X45_22925 [Lentisphaerae bacterium GWF2_50_93]HCE46734.1 hypothetical protein [Lentisphaeria bacterium]